MFNILAMLVCFFFIPVVCFIATPWCGPNPLPPLFRSPNKKGRLTTCRTSQLFKDGDIDADTKFKLMGEVFEGLRLDIKELKEMHIKELKEMQTVQNKQSGDTQLLSANLSAEIRAVSAEVKVVSSEVMKLSAEVKENNKALSAEIMKVSAKVEENIKALSAEMKENIKALSAEMKENNKALSDEIMKVSAESKENNKALSAEMKEVNTKLTDEIKALSKTSNIVITILLVFGVVSGLDKTGVLEAIAALFK